MSRASPTSGSASDAAKGPGHAIRRSCFHFPRRQTTPNGFDGYVRSARTSHSPRVTDGRGRSLASCTVEAEGVQTLGQRREAEQPMKLRLVAPAGSPRTSTAPRQSTTLTWRSAAAIAAADIQVGVGDLGGAVLVRGLPAGATSRSFNGLLGFTPLAEGLDALGLELCTTPDCGLVRP